MSGIISLTTDFGPDSSYVGAMKGVVLSLNPTVRLVDLTHAIPPQNIRRAALAVADTTPFFPDETIHVVVVDPGVGTSRAIVYARFGKHHFVAPDNGVLGCLARREPPSKIFRVTNASFWLHDVSSTFHGRDIMAPVAAHLSLGVDPAQLGPPLSQLQPLPWPEVRTVPHRLEGEVVAIDSFGNLITNITREMLVDAPRDDSLIVTCEEHRTHGLFQSYGEQPPMTLVALLGSSDRLEIAIVDDSAAIMLGVREGGKVEISW